MGFTNNMSNPKRIPIYINPETETLLTLKELAAFLTISVPTLKQRLRDLGEDHYLTYYFGPIPSKIRRKGLRAVKRRNLFKGLSCDRIQPEDLNYRVCVAFITRLIEISKEHFLERRCRVSKAFLLNKSGMLKYYLELIPNIDVDKYIKEMESWVRVN